MTPSPEPCFSRCLISQADDRTLLVRAKCGTRVEWVEIDLDDIPARSLPLDNARTRVNDTAVAAA